MGANCLNFIVAWFFVYETESLTLEQVDSMYNSGVPAWRSRSWVPEGYTSRNEVKQEGGVEEESMKLPDSKPNWRSKPDPVTGEETDKTRKAPETVVSTGGGSSGPSSEA